MKARETGAILLIASMLSACAGNPVRAREVAFADLVRAHTSSAYEGREPSDRTLALLDRLGLDTSDHEAAIERLAEPFEAVAKRERLLARAELLYYLGDHGNPTVAAERFLEAAFDALAAFTQPDADLAIDPLRNEAMDAYDYALTRFLTDCIDGELDAAGLIRRLREDYALELDWQHDGPWSVDDFDRWVCADTLRFDGMRHRYRRRGAGAPLILQRDAERGIPKYLTPEAVTRAATAVLHPPRTDATRGRLEILDPRTTWDVEITDGVMLPLAADFTAPFGYLLSQARLHELENSSFFDSFIERREGLYLLEDYDPNRRPVVMVHGLWSSPLTWRDLTNDIFGDESLHGEYQVWHYMYATGTPLLENARQLREALNRAREDLDPEGDDFATREWILVGHSMGGLLSRMSLVATGEAMWKTLFEGDFDDVELHLEDRDRELARGLYFWEPLPFVERAIFIAAPLRGSQLSDSWIGRLGSSMMVIPKRLLGLVDRIRGRAGVRVEVPTSVDELSGSHPVMQTLISLEIRDGVTYHSIMGDVSGSANPAEWTDGVVPYSSSHLDGAASELVIPNADHGVHFDPRASAEVRRILRDALRESDD